MMDIATNRSLASPEAICLAICHHLGLLYRAEGIAPCPEVRLRLVARAGTDACCMCQGQPQL
jgi:hypothetical protein